MPTLSASRFDDLFHKSIPALTQRAGFAVSFGYGAPCGAVFVRMKEKYFKPYLPYHEYVEFQLQIKKLRLYDRAKKIVVAFSQRLHHVLIIVLNLHRSRSHNSSQNGILILPQAQTQFRRYSSHTQRLSAAPYHSTHRIAPAWL